MEQIDRPDQFKCIIQLQAFLNMCYKINSILSKFGYFLRVFELKNIFRHLTTKDNSQPKIVRQLSSCLIEKYSDFTIISIENQQKNKESYLNQSILFTNQLKILKWNQFVIFLMILLKHIHLYIQKVKKD